MKTIKVLGWFIVTIVAVNFGLHLLSISSTAANIIGLCIVVITAVISVKTRCFTTINIYSHKNKNKKK